MAAFRKKSTFAVMSMIVLVSVVLPTVGTGTGNRAEADPVQWKGAETFSPVTVGPNPTRCGAAPPNVFAVFAGNGVDSRGGVFEVNASGCMNLDTLRLFNLEATDTFVRTGEQIFIAPADVTLTLNQDSCIATNDGPVPFTVAGGTGRYKDATGRGTFDVAMNHPPCNGLVHPVHVWFKGELNLRH